jgi:hypothetical protein
MSLPDLYSLSVQLARNLAAIRLSRARGETDAELAVWVEQVAELAKVVAETETKPARTACIGRDTNVMVS